MRLDQLLVTRGLTPSRQRAKELILQGQVLVEDAPIQNPAPALALMRRYPSRVFPGLSKQGRPEAGESAEGLSY